MLGRSPEVLDTDDGFRSTCAVHLAPSALEVSGLAELLEIVTRELSSLAIGSFTQLRIRSLPWVAIAIRGLGAHPECL